VNEVVPAGELMAAARRWADEIVACAPLSVRASKQVAMASLDGGSIGDLMGRRYEQVYEMLKSEDFVEGPRAFAEKRPPVWKGK
jgi:enoyl-CoA hydratase/carnithine racemase